MSLADARRIMALEGKIADLAERGRVLVARVAALEDHIADFQAAVEARQTLEWPTATPAPSHAVPALQGPPAAPVNDAEACSSCARRREQAQARLRRHRVKIAAAEGKSLQGTLA